MANDVRQLREATADWEEPFPEYLEDLLPWATCNPMPRNGLIRRAIANQNRDLFMDHAVVSAAAFPAPLAQLLSVWQRLRRCRSAGGAWLQAPRPACLYQVLCQQDELCCLLGCLAV